ncbi:MAG: pilin [Patescibacteria group bacterium]|nr:pilin [Patescibacteria group bacterium]
MKSKIFKFALAAALIFNAAAFALPARAADACADFRNKFVININGKEIDTLGGTPIICSLQQALIVGIKYALGLAGTVTIVFLIMGGYWYLTAAGSEEQAEKGRKTIINSIIGLVVIVMATAIVRITTNALSGNLGNAGGGNSGTNVTPSTPSERNTTPPAELTSEQAAANVAAGITIPSEVPSNGKLVITAIYSFNDEPSIRKVCNSDSADQAYITVYWSGQNLGSIELARQGQSSRTGTLEMPASQLPASSGTVAVNMCGIQIAQQQVTVKQVADFSGVGGAYTQEQINQAAQGSSFTTNWTNNNRDLHLSISATNTNVKIMCSNTPAASQLITFYVNGAQQGPGETLTVRGYTLGEAGASGNPSSFKVSVKICGQAIGGGEQTITRP